MICCSLFLRILISSAGSLERGHLSMPEVVSFQDLLSRVRAADPEAARVIVSRYETAIRVAVRTRMSDPALRRQFDSVDVCQSVLGSFFLRMAAGLYELNEPAQLIALLTAMAQKKLAMRVRYASRQRRDLHRSSSPDLDALPPDVSAADPMELAMNSELVQRAYSLMDPETRMIARHRTNDSTWMEIAAAMGGTPESRRKQYERALNRIAIVLGIDEDAPGSEQEPN